MTHEVLLYCNTKPSKGKGRRSHSSRKSPSKTAVARDAGASAKTSPAQHASNTVTPGEGLKNGLISDVSRAAKSQAPKVGDLRGQHATLRTARAPQQAQSSALVQGTPATTTHVERSDGATVTESVNEHGNRIVKRVVRRTVQRSAGAVSEPRTPNETVEIVTGPDGRRKKIIRRVVRKKVTRAPASEKKAD